MVYPLKMVPAFKDYVWGGCRLKSEFNKVSDLPVIAESWEVSTHPDGLSMVANGEFAGQALKDVLERRPQWAAGFCCSGLPEGGLPAGEFPRGEPRTGELPVLIKLIDACDNLSLQVHPGDEYARRVEGQSGKNEMWYVVSAEPGAELILGFEYALGKDDLRRLIDSGDILPAARRVKVTAGDCYTIPAGLLHAIGKGIVIAEVQQMSNVTYRVYDYGRIDSNGKSRELHIDKALDVLDTRLAAKKAGPDILADWEFFKSRLITVGECGVWSVERGVSAGFECLLVTDAPRNGVVTLKYDGGELSLRKGESVFIPAGLGGYTMASDGGSAAAVSTRCVIAGNEVTKQSG